MPALLLASLIWACSFGLIKRHLAGVDPAWVTAARLGLAALVFLPFARPRLLGLRGAAALRPRDRKSTRLNSSHTEQSRMPSSA